MQFKRFLNSVHTRFPKGIIIASICVAVLSIFALTVPVGAQSTVINTMIGWVAQTVIELLGKLLITLIEILIAVVQYNDFINAPAVTRGWILVRDFANMAFLIIFIVIAFVTILGVEKYEWKRLLPKLLIMAVAINFSKTIAGIVLDAAQVVMMTFVNGFKDVAAGNLIRGFGISEMLKLGEVDATNGPSTNAVAAASLLAVLLLVIAVVTVGIMVLMFLIRIIYLWILIVLAPLAFMLAAAPGVESKFNDWWQRFIRYAFVGPILAFFLWLSFSIMAQVPPGSNIAEDSGIPLNSVANRTSATITAVGSSDMLLSFGISIALLLLSLSIANSMGTAGGSLAGDALGKIKGVGKTLAKGTALGVATGGVGIPAAIAAKRGIGFAGGKAVGAFKAINRNPLGNYALKEIDRKVGSKITRPLSSLAARTTGALSKVPGLGSLKNTSEKLKLFGEKDSAQRFSKWKETWVRETKRDRETRSMVSEARFHDKWNERIRGRKTDTAGRVANSIVNQMEKEAAEESEDEDSMVARYIQAGEEFQKALEKGDDFATRQSAYVMLGLEQLITKNNAQNTTLAKLFSEGKVTPELIASMGNLKEAPDNAAKYLETFHADDENLMNQVAHIRTNENADERREQYKALMRQVEGDMSDTEMEKKIGNKLYAKKYKVYSSKQGKLEQWKDKQDGTFDENAVLADDVMIDGRAAVADPDGIVRNTNKYGGSNDAPHWQQMQKMFHGTDKVTKKKERIDENGNKVEEQYKVSSIDNALKVDNYTIGFERDLGNIHAIKANNASFAFTTKYDDAQGKQVQLNLADFGDLDEHDNYYGGKLQNFSAADAVKLHPMTVHIQSVSIDQNGNAVGYYNDNAPSHKQQELQAWASLDPRVLNNMRLDALLGHIGLDRSKVKYPFTDQQKANGAKQYYRKFNPKNGSTVALPENIFTQLGIRILKTIGAEGVTNENSAKQYFESLGLSSGNEQGTSDASTEEETPQRNTDRYRGRGIV